MKHGERTKLRILQTGIALWPDVTISNVARSLGFRSHRAVSYHFPADQIKDAVADYAVVTGDARIIVELIASNHSAVHDMSAADRQRWFKSI